MILIQILHDLDRPKLAAELWSCNRSSQSLHRGCSRCCPRSQTPHLPRRELSIEEPLDTQEEVEVVRRICRPILKVLIESKQKDNLAEELDKFLRKERCSLRGPDSLQGAALGSPGAEQEQKVDGLQTMIAIEEAAPVKGKDFEPEAERKVPSPGTARQEIGAPLKIGPGRWSRTAASRQPKDPPPSSETRPNSHQFPLHTSPRRASRTLHKRMWSLWF